MDINTLSHMIEWLDEERRKDKTTILLLEERLAKQDDVIAQLTSRVNGLESDQTVLKQGASTLAPASMQSGTIEQLRQEIRRMIEQAETRRLHAEAETDKRINSTREGLSQTINELTATVERLQNSLKSITDLRERAERLNDLSIQLNQRIDEFDRRLTDPERRLALIEEQLRQNTKRTTQAEGELAEIKRSIETVRSRLPMIEDLTLRNETNIKSLQNSEHDRRDQLQSFIDAQELQNQQRDLKFTALYRGFEDRQRELRDFAERFEQWEETYRDMKRLVDNFDRIASNLERRIGEVAELQRLSEDRFRNEWNVWQESEQRKWRELSVTQDDIWRNHDREFEGYTRRLSELEKETPSLGDSLQRLWNLERARAQLYRERYQALLTEFDSPASGNPQQNGFNVQE